MAKCPGTMTRRIHDTEARYYADGEDAFDMKKQLDPKPPPSAAQKQGEVRHEPPPTHTVLLRAAMLIHPIKL